jgi:hypothetical protein
MLARPPPWLPFRCGAVIVLSQNILTVLVLHSPQEAALLRILPQVREVTLRQGLLKDAVKAAAQVISLASALCHGVTQLATLRVCRLQLLSLSAEVHTTHVHRYYDHRRRCATSGARRTRPKPRRNRGGSHSRTWLLRRTRQRMSLRATARCAAENTIEASNNVLLGSGAKKPWQVSCLTQESSINLV